MFRRRDWRAVGRIERAFALIVILVLFVVGVQHMLVLTAEAERSAMTTTLHNLRSALRLAALSHLVRGDSGGIAALTAGNPVLLPGRPPSNYRGERRTTLLSSADPSGWYFDPGRRLLIYKVDHPGRFETPLTAPARAHFRVGIAYRDVDGNGGFGARDVFTGISLMPVEPYRWK